MYAKFKWDFLNGKSKSHIDLTVGFNCIVCHIFKLFTNQHFNYSMCWQTLGQIKSSIFKCHCKVCYPKFTRLFYWEEWRGMGKQRANFLQRQEIWHRQSLGMGPPGCFRPPLSPCDSAGVKQLLSMELNWVSFEVDLFLIREILPFMCLSPGCQVWTVRSHGSLGPLPVGGMDIFPEIWFDLVHSQPSAFCLAFSLTSSITAGLGKLSPGRCPWAASEFGKNVCILQTLCFITEGR